MSNNRDMDFLISILFGGLPGEKTGMPSYTATTSRSRPFADRERIARLDPEIIAIERAEEERKRAELADWWDYVLSDDTVWHDRRRTSHVIAKMDTEYIRNTINWLKRHAEGLANKCISADDREVMDADHWLHHTPVMMALCDELLNR